jgi:hypothetical protein
VAGAIGRVLCRRGSGVVIAHWIGIATSRVTLTPWQQLRRDL